jgi:hypothetical protein
MKQHALLFAAALVAAAAAGCGKSSDLAPISAEASGIIEFYQARATHLEQRARDLVRRRDAIRPGPEVQHVMAQLTHALEDLIPTMQRNMQEAKARISGAASDDKTDPDKKVAALRTYRYQLEHGLTEDWIQANAQLDAVEALLDRLESRRAQAPTGGAGTAPATNTPVPPNTPTTEPAPAGAGGAGAGGADAAGGAAGAAGGTFPAGDPRAAGAGSDAAAK